MPTIEDSHAGEARDKGHGARYEQQQRRRMGIALAVLVIALILVVVKDRQFWFPSSATDSEATDSPAPSSAATIPSPPPQPAASAVPEKALLGATIPSRTAKSHNAVVRSAPAKPVPEPTMPTIVATNRAVLPPLQVEVVAGNQHHPIQSANNPLNLDLQPGAAAAPDQALQQSPARDNLHSEPNATASVQLSPDTAQILSRPVNPNYPLLAKQMKVQGAVVLQALISKTGTIQDIHVLSGPAILSAAAREAVQQWRFKPYLQAGQPVETEARITVNFTISTY